MDFFALIRERRSIRVFAPRSVLEVLLNRMLEAANAAPSAGNRLYSIQDSTSPARSPCSPRPRSGWGPWVGVFRDDHVRLIIGAPGGLQPVGILPVGYAAEAPKPAPRGG